MGASGGSALCFGALPTSPPETLDAVFSARPAAFPERANAILALGLASQQPHFTLVLQGAITITISHYLAVFHIILLFAQARLRCWHADAPCTCSVCMRRSLSARSWP